MRRSWYSQAEILKREAIASQKDSDRLYREARDMPPGLRWISHTDAANDYATISRACLFQLIENQKYRSHK